MLRFRFTEFTKGVVDSCRVWQAFQSSRTLKNIAWRLLPLYVMTIILGLWFHTIDRYGLYPEDWIKHAVLWGTWSVLWGAPIYVLGSVLQLRYAWRIRAAATSHRVSKQSGLREGKDVNNVVVQTLYGALLNLTFIFQVWVINTVIGLVLPQALSGVLQTAFSVINVAWATSFAAFESRLITKNKDLFQRVIFVEVHWAYALGYGTIVSILYHLAPSAIVNGLWQYAVLLLMLNAMRLKPLQLPTPIRPRRQAEARDQLMSASLPRRRRRPPKVCDLGSQFRYQLRVFYLAQTFAIYVIHQLNILLQSIGGEGDTVAHPPITGVQGASESEQQPKPK